MRLAVAVLTLALTPAATLATSTPQVSVQGIAIVFGDERILAPYPAGYMVAPAELAALSEVSSRVMPGNHRLLGAFLLETDLARAAVGVPPIMNRYMLLQAARRNEHLRYSDTDFQSLRSYVRSVAPMLFAASTNRILDRLAGISTRMLERGLGQPEYGFDKPVDLGVIMDMPDAIAVAGVIQRTASHLDVASQETAAVSIGYVRLKGKLVMATVYARMDSPADIEWTRQATRSWCANLLAANR